MIALWILLILARPINWWRGLLAAAMAISVATILAVPIFRDFYALELPPLRVAGEAVAIAMAGIVLIELGWRTTRHVDKRQSRDGA